MGDGRRLLGLEARPAFPTTHDRAHKRKETVPVFSRRNRTDLVLYTKHATKVRTPERQDSERRTYPISRHALPYMLKLLYKAVRRQDVDDAEVVHWVAGLIQFTRRA